MFFDSHCHLDVDSYESELDSLLAEARRLGVSEWFVPGVAPSRWSLQWQRVGARAGVLCGFGVHPYWVHEVVGSDASDWVSALRQAALEHRVSAIGECGLDALKAKRGGAALELQVTALRHQLELARELKLPVVLHCVRAHGRLLELLHEADPLPSGGVLHSYSGAPELVGPYAALGFYFGFGGAVTRSGAKRARAALARVPADRLVLETDAPDQSPEWHSGPNRPEQLVRIAHLIAGLRGCSLEELGRKTTENARRLFGVGEAR